MSPLFFYKKYDKKPETALLCVVSGFILLLTIKPIISGLI